jgi:predicted outer membrane protein
MRTRVVIVPAVLTVVAAGVVWAQASSGSSGKPSETQVVLGTMHQLNRLEVRLGRLAERKGTRLDIRRYGALLTRDHHFGNQEVTKVVHAGRLTLPPLKELPAATMLEAAGKRAGQLGQASGVSFDRSFLAMAVQTHEMAIRMLKAARDRLPAGKARRLVSRVLPILEQDAKLAQDIEGRGLPMRDQAVGMGG